MKKLLLLLCLIPLQGISQSFTHEITLLDTTYTWQVGVFSFGMPQQTLYYRIQGDTTYGGELYKKVEVALDSVFTNAYVDGFVHEDTVGQVVWLKDVHNLCGPEEPLFRMTLLAGDSSLGYTCAPVPYFVDSTWSEMIDGQNRKVILFAPDGPFGLQELWIEGIGSTFILVKPHHNFCIMDLEYDLLCVKKNGSTLWMNPLFMTCQIGNNAVREAGTQTNQWTAHPNPAANHLLIEMPAGMGCDEIRILSLDGRLVSAIWTALPTGIKIDVQQLPAGIYTLQLKDAAGNLTQGRFCVAR